MINWRDAKEETPKIEDEYMPYCLVAVKHENNDIEVIGDIYDHDYEEYDGCGWSDWRECVVAWCYMSDLIKTIPNKFKG